MVVTPIQELHSQTLREMVTNFIGKFLKQIKQMKFECKHTRENNSSKLQSSLSYFGVERVSIPKQQAQEWSSKVQGSKHCRRFNSKSRSRVKFMRFQVVSQGTWSLGKWMTCCQQRSLSWLLFLNIRSWCCPSGRMKLLSCEEPQRTILLCLLSTWWGLV